MAQQRTFSIIKPDATARNLTGKINAMIRGGGPAHRGAEAPAPEPAQAEKFYEVHKDRPFL